MQLSRIALKNPEFTMMVFFLLVSLGILAYITMPRYESPQIEVPGVILVILYPGASPEDIENLVVDPLEEAIQEIDNLTKLTSDIRDGFARIRVEFVLSEDKVEKNTEVSQKISQVQNTLPEGVILQTFEFSVTNIQILQVALYSSQAGYARLEKEAQKFKEAIELHPGVKEVKLEAIPERRLLIALDFQKLAHYQISPGQVVQTIQGNNANIPAGNLQIGQKTFNLQTSGAYQTIGEIENTILKSVQNQPVLIKDIASVYFSDETPQYTARYQEKRAVFVSVFPKDNVNALKTIAHIKPLMEELVPGLPLDISSQIVFDQSVSIKNKVNLLFTNLWQGILVVGLFILLFFNFRASMLVMVAIPLSFLIGLIAADYADFGLQFMSIAGLIIALGLLVDNAIVVVENVYHFIKEGYGRKAAAEKAVDQVGWAIVSSTATTILAFIPVITIKSLPGEYIKSMPLTLIFTLLASLFVALTFTPFLSSRLLKSSQEQKESRVQQYINHFIQTIYRSILRFALQHKVLILTAALLALGGAAALYPRIGVSFFPRDDAPLFAVNITTPQGTVLSKTEEAVLYVERQLKKQKEVDYFISNTGYGNPRVINVIERNEQQTSSGQVMVFMKDIEFEERDAMIGRLRKKFAQYKDAKIELKEALLGPPVEAQISIKLYGEELDTLKRIAGEVERVIRQTPHTINVYNPLKNLKTDLKLQINKLAAANLAVPLAEVDRNVRIAVAGTKVAEFRDAMNDTYPVYVQMQRGEEYLHPTDLSGIYVTSLTGLQVPLSQLATLGFVSSPEKINHDRTRRTFAVNADVESGNNVDDVTEQVIQQLEGYPFPKGYTYSIAGERESREEAFGDLFKSLLLAMLGIFTVLVLQFRSFIQPLIIFTAIPLSLIGATLGLFLAGYSFSFTAFLGIISLVGIVVNDSIILIDLTNQYIESGISKYKAIQQAAEHRFVPIILTSLTTIGGLLPLTLKGGLFWAPMGWCIIGGLITSTLLILIVVPVLYALFTSAKRKMKKMTV